MLVGRAVELSRLLALRDQTAEGATGSAVLLTGTSGTGKSALLDEFERCASGCTVLKATGVPAEAAVGFAGLSDLLRPVLPQIEHLRPAWSAALRAALAIGPPSPGDRLAVYEACSDVLRRVAASALLVVLVDDAHWLDEPSRDAIAYAARRSPAIGALFVIGVRPEEVPPSFLARVERLELRPLDRDDARALLRSVVPDVSYGVEEAVLDHALGNPLAIVEIARNLSEAERRADAPVVPSSLLPPRLRDLYSHRFESLSAPARDVVLFAALSRFDTMEVLQAACALAHLDVDEIEQAVDRGLVRVDDGRIRFRHPLVRAAAIDLAVESRRRWAHRHLADVMPSIDAAWHRASASLGPDESVAEALDAAAVDGLARRAHATAAAAYERAARMTTRKSSRAGRLFAAGSAALGAGDAGRAHRLLEESIDTATTSSERAAAAHLAGVVEMWFTSARRAHERLVEAAAAVASDDRAASARMLADAALAATAWDCALALATAERAVAAASGGSVAETVLAGTTHAWCLTLRGQGRRAARVLDEVEPLLAQVDLTGPAGQSVLFALNVQVQSERYDQAHLLARMIADGAADFGAPSARPFPLCVVAEVAHRQGRWGESLEAFTEAESVAVESRQLGSVALSALGSARLHAARGDAPACRDAVDRGLIAAAAVGMESSAVFAGAAVGLLLLGTGDPSGAVSTLEQVAIDANRLGFRDPLFVPWIPDLIEAYALLGRPSEAARVVDQFAGMVADTEAAGAHAALARCRALVDDDFERHIEDALAQHAASGVPFERARTLLVLGRRRRRTRRKAAARAVLREAHGEFARLGAGPWATLAATDLRILDGRGATSVGSGLTTAALTPQQERIVAAVARGARNREIAEELYVSVKTVERHLESIFRSTGVRSRTELALWVRTRDAPGPGG